MARTSAVRKGWRRFSNSPSLALQACKVPVVATSPDPGPTAGLRVMPPIGRPAVRPSRRGRRPAPNRADQGFVERNSFRCRSAGRRARGQVQGNGMNSVLPTSWPSPARIALTRRGDELGDGLDVDGFGQVVVHAGLARPPPILLLA